jgi:hypothetical protein
VLVAWGAFTLHATGRFAFGADFSSLNRYNLYNGYTLSYGEIAPRYHIDVPVARGEVNVDKPVHDEWEMSDQFKERTYQFVREHPGLVMKYFVIKAYAALFKPTPEYRLQSGEDGFFRPKHLVVTAGLFLDRLVLWLSFAASIAICWRSLRRHGLRSLLGDETFGHTLMLIVSAAFVAPFIIAFVSYRHIVPLYYFQVPYLVSLMLYPSLLDGSRWAGWLLRLAGRPTVAAA